jgi:hypothetical protein
LGGSVVKKVLQMVVIFGMVPSDRLLEEDLKEKHF